MLERRASLSSRTGGGVLASEGSGVQDTLAETRPRRAAAYDLSQVAFEDRIQRKPIFPESWATEKPNAVLSQKGQALATGE